MNEWGSSYSKKRHYQIGQKVSLNNIINGGKIFLYLILIFLFAKYNLSLGVLLVLISYYDSYFIASKSIMASDASIKEENVSLMRITELLDSVPVNDFGNKTITNCIGNIEFNNVTFSYNNKPIIKNATFNIEANNLTCIVGEFGSGKTTLFNLLVRLRRPDAGCIFFDGEDIFNITKNSFVNNVAILNQDSYIFNLSIRDNLTLVEKDMNKCVNICKRLGIHKFISSLPDGYDTIISENQGNISGGQKRLLALARTLLTGAKVLLFDEATSSLDIHTTQVIIEILKELKKDHTVLVVTHKEELMRASDQIIVLNNGKVSGKGTHFQLIRNNKNYRKLQNKEAKN